MQLPLHPFTGQGRQIHGAAQGHRLLRHGEAEAGGELRSPQHPQGILREGAIVHVAQEAPAEILPAAEEVQHLTGEHVLHQGVDGEIPAAGGSLRPQPRVHLHGEVPVAPTHGGLPPGHGDVQSAARQSVDAKAGPHRPAAAHPVQHSFQLLGGDAVDLDIQILALPAQQPVPDAAAHIVDAAAQRLHLLCDAAGRLTIPCHAVSPPVKKAVATGHGFCVHARMSPRSSKVWALVTTTTWSPS